MKMPGKWTFVDCKFIIGQPLGSSNLVAEAICGKHLKNRAWLGVDHFKLNSGN